MAYWVVVDPKSRSLNTGALGFDEQEPLRSVGTYFVALYRQRKQAVEAAQGWPGAKIVKVRIVEVK